MRSAKVLSWVDNGCYPGCVMLSCGFSYDELLTLIKRKGVKGYEWREIVEYNEQFIRDHQYAAFYYENDKFDKYMMIFLRNRFTFTDEDYTALAHEITHICQFFLPNILDRNEEREAEAYYHSHLMKKCLQDLRLKPAGRKVKLKVSPEK